MDRASSQVPQVTVSIAIVTSWVIDAVTCGARLQGCFIRRASLSNEQLV